MMKYIVKLAVVPLFLLAIFGTTAMAQPRRVPHYNRPEWVQPYRPFKVAGNVYYVGTYDLGSYLITTPQGHILINTGLEGSLPNIISNINELGFRFSDVKILLTNQAHPDHVGAMAEAKTITGADVMISEPDAKILADGGYSDPIFGGRYSWYTPVQPDRILYNGSIVSLGGVRIHCLLHPGHTPGSMSFLLDVPDNGHTYRLLIANIPTMLAEVELPTMRTYPTVKEDFEYTYAAMRELKFDIWVAAHASQFYLHKKHKPGDKYNPMAFSDREGYDLELNELEQEFTDKLKKSSQK